MMNVRFGAISPRYTMESEEGKAELRHLKSRGIPCSVVYSSQHGLRILSDQGGNNDHTLFQNFVKATKLMFSRSNEIYADTIAPVFAEGDDETIRANMKKAIETAKANYLA